MKVGENPECVEKGHTGRLWGAYQALKMKSQERGSFPVVSDTMLRIYDALASAYYVDGKGLTMPELVQSSGVSTISTRNPLQTLPGALAVHCPEFGVKVAAELAGRGEHAGGAGGQFMVYRVVVEEEGTRQKAQGTSAEAQPLMVLDPLLGTLVSVNQSRSDVGVDYPEIDWESASILEWVPVAERAPDKLSHVLLGWASGECFEGFLAESGWKYGNYAPVPDPDFWCEKPKPPTDKKAIPNQNRKEK